MTHTTPSMPRDAQPRVDEEEEEGGRTWCLDPACSDVEVDKVMEGLGLEESGQGHGATIPDRVERKAEGAGGGRGGDDACSP